MRRRSKASGKLAKARRHQAKVLKPARRSSSSVAGQETEVARLRRERDEALERETATAEVLRLISKSPGDLELVFRTILEDATRICDAKFGTLFRFYGKMFNFAAVVGSMPEFVEFERRRGPFQPTPGSHLERVMRTKRVSHTADYAAEGVASPPVTLGGARSTVDVPMLKDNELIGVLSIYRQEVRPFTDKQIELLQNFAAQAVIAIENTRLLNELRESLQQQTATADVLKVISHSTFDLQRVLDTLVVSATRLCEAYDSVIFLRQGEQLSVKAHHGPIPMDLTDWPVGRGWVTGRAVVDRTPVHVHDLQAFAQEFADGAKMAQRMGHRTILAVPIMTKHEAIGAITIRRTEVKPFTEKQIELVTTFADQAVIAIENVRLFEAEQRRTRELTESLEQQTATSEVLKIISGSPGELESVFNAMLENATRLCEARYGTMWLREGDTFRAASLYGLMPPAYTDLLRSGTLFHASPDTPTGRVVQTRQPVQVLDLREIRSSDPIHVAAVEVAGVRTMFAVPMLKEGQLVGTISIYRQEILPFTNKQIELVQNFAAQAVIAIENARLLNELRESLEQQTATTEVLKVISSSPGALEPVFHAMLESAVRICEAKFGTLYRFDGAAFYHAAGYGTPDALIQVQKNMGRFVPETGTLMHRVMGTKAVTHSADYAAETNLGLSAKFGGARSTVVVPMLKDDELVGAFAIYRQEVRPFTEKQIALVQSFAAQAVIAIENTRLLNELRQSLEQQTAAADVLRIISSSPGELEPVFQAMLENAVRICDAKFGILFRFERDVVRPAGMVRVSPEFAEFVRHGVRPSPVTAVGRVVASKKAVHIIDLQTDPGYRERDPMLVAGVELAGIRTLIAVPMLKENTVIGVIGIYRQEVQPFTDKQVALVQNFADQAVIAIENTRLLNELRHRTADLAESLEQQTATSEVLRVINLSSGELEPVFQAMLENAVRICDAKFGELFRFDGHAFHFAAEVGTPAELVEFQRQRGPFQPEPGTHLNRVIRTKQVSHTADTAAEAVLIAPAKYGGARSIVAVPMLKDDVLIGAISIFRQEVRPFTDKQIALVQNFAAQAVIAIENARLLDELRQSLQQQTATADVLKVISRSAFDLQTVLHTLVESAVHLCEADKGTITRQRGNVFYRAESYGFSAQFMDYVKDVPLEPERGSASGRALLEGRVIHIPDVKNDPDYTWVEAQKLDDYRTIIAVPMLRERVPIGVLTLTRSEVRPFTDRQVELVTTFADQAAIAIENVRLFDEIQEKSRQLEEASQHKSQFLANMSHELRTPLNAILGYTELMADGAYGEPSDKMLGILKRLEANGKHLLGLINDVLDLSKIEAGQLELELSDYCIQDIAQTVRSTLEPLAADKKLTFKVEVAQQVPPGRGDGRRLTQVLINLVGNAIKFTDAGEVAIKAEANNGAFHVSVHDTGPGISAVDQARLFQEFQQADNAITRKKGGTGLGLAISKRIIEMHGGKIWVESQVGQGSTFAFSLPVIVERQVEKP
jgi:GAF domain-containing protein